MTPTGSPDPAAGGAPRRPSLRLRVGLLGLLTVGVSLGLVGWALDAAYRRAAESDLRQQMETWVYLALAATELAGEDSLQVRGELADPLLNQPGSGVYLRVEGPMEPWTSGSALGQSLPALPRMEPGEERYAVPGAAGAFHVLQEGLAWERGDGGLLPFTVSVLVEADHLQPEIRAFRRGLWRSLGAAGLLLAATQLLFLYLALRPLRQVAADVARIERGEKETLGAAYPRELEPLSRNLERLLRTEKANQERYRNALDSLAHSLKTPLAVIRSRVGPGDDAAVQEALADMQHLIGTRLQRAASGTRRALAAPVAVRPVVERVAASLRRVHSQALRKLDVTIDPGLMFYGEERDLMEIAGNLVENACKYGGGTVVVEAGAVDPGGARPGLWLSVENDGRAVDLEPYLQRGARGDERAEGQGLGLAIVSEVVKAYGGGLEFGTGGLGGVRVTVRLPPS